MKIKSNFLLALSGIALSCANLAQSTLLINENAPNHPTTTSANQERIGYNRTSDKNIYDCCVQELSILIDNFHAYWQRFNELSKGPTSHSNMIYRLFEFAIYIAVDTNRPIMLLKFIDFLIEKRIKINLNAKTLFEKHIFHYPIWRGHIAVLDLLMHKAPLVHSQPDQIPDLVTLLDYAIQLGQKGIAEYLFDRLVARAEEAPLTQIHGQYKTISFVDLIDYAIDLKKIESARYLFNILMTLIKQGPLMHFYRKVKNIHYVDLLDYAIRLNTRNHAKYLLKHWVNNDFIENLNQQDDMYGQTLLMRIAFSSHPGWHKIFTALLHKNADITIQDRDGQNVLMHLCTRLGYTYATNYNPNNSNEQVCNDKKKMLKSLFSHKDIIKIIDHLDNDGKHTVAYANELMRKIWAVDICTARFVQGMFNTFLDLGFND